MYGIDFAPGVREELWRIWSDSDDPNAVTDAVAELDVLIRTDPGAGESRDPGERVVFRPPIGIRFREPGPDGIIRITNVWEIAGPAGA